MHRLSHFLWVYSLSESSINNPIQKSSNVPVAPDTAVRKIFGVRLQPAVSICLVSLEAGSPNRRKSVL